MDEVLELLELLEGRYPDHTPLVEVTPFNQGKAAGVRSIINEIKTEVKNAKGKR